MEDLALEESSEAGCFAWLVDGVGGLEVGFSFSQQNWKITVRKGGKVFLYLKPNSWLSRKAGMEDYISRDAVEISGYGKDLSPQFSKTGYEHDKILLQRSRNVL